MYVFVRRASLLAVAMTLGASPALAHEPDRDYWCVGDCVGIGIRDEETGQATFLLEGVLERGTDGSAPATGSVAAEIGRIWIEDGDWEVTLEGVCEADSEPVDGIDDWVPADGLITVEFDLTEGEAPSQTVSLEYIASQGADAIAMREENGPFQSTTQSIHLGPSGWGAGEYLMSASATSETAAACFWDVEMTSVPEDASA